MAAKERGRLRSRPRVDGRRLSQTFPAGTPKSVVADWERKVKLGLITKAKDEDPCPTLEDYAKRFLRVYPATVPGGLQESTVAGYRTKFRCHLLPVFGRWRLHDIKPKHVLDFQATLLQGIDEEDEGYEAQSVRNIISTLSVVMKLAVIEERIEYNPCASVPRVSRDWKEPAYWSFDEKDSFLCAVHQKDFELFQVAAFACDTGARIGELEGLLGDCLNLRDGYVEFKRTFCTKTRKVKDRTKNNLPRRVYLTPEIIRVMQTKQKVGTEERVFPLNFNLLSLERLTPWCEKAKVRRLTAHGWRHTFASHLLMLGKPPKDVQTALGHKRIATTLDTYGHLLEDYKKGTTEGLNRNLKWVRSIDTKIVPLFANGQ